MNFGGDRRSGQTEPEAPMINIAFLLLIFFLIAATIAPADPVEVSPPLSVSGEAVDATTPLIIAADGTLAYGDLRGDAALSALEGPDGAVLHVRADAEARATMLTAVLGRLREIGIGEVVLLVESPQ